MVNFKKILSLFLVAAMAVGLVACAADGGGGTTTAPAGNQPAAQQPPAQGGAAETPATTGEPVTIVFWDMATGNEQYPIAAAEHAATITYDFPNITIEYQSIPWANRLEVFLTALAANAAPDFSNGGGFQSFQFYAMGEIMDITPIIDRWREDGTLAFYDYSMIEYFRVGDSQVGIPIGYDPRFMLYRQDWFEEAGIAMPTTWEEMFEAAVHFTDPANHVYGFASPAALAGGNVLFYTWLTSNGGGVWTNDGLAPYWTRPENVEVVEFLRRMRDAGVFPPGMSSYDSAEAIQAAIGDNAAMVLVTAGHAGSEIARTHYGRFALMPVPAGPSANGRQGSTISMNAFMAYTQTAHPQETMDALAWWATTFYRLTFMPELGIGSVPPRSDWQQDPRYLEGMGDLYLRDFILGGHMERVHTLVSPAPNVVCWLTQNAFDSERWFTRLYQAILTTDTPALQLLEEFQAEAEAVLADFQAH